MKLINSESSYFVLEWITFVKNNSNILLPTKSFITIIQANKQCVIPSHIFEISQIKKCRTMHLVLKLDFIKFREVNSCKMCMVSWKGFLEEKILFILKIIYNSK